MCPFLTPLVKEHGEKRGKITKRKNETLLFLALINVNINLQRGTYAFGDKQEG